MRHKPEPVVEYLEYIQQAIERVERYTENLDKAGFLQSDLVQDAVIRNIENIGDASRSIDRQFPEFTAHNIPMCLFVLPMRCEMFYPTVILKWIFKYYGERSKMTYRFYIHRL